jgi:hypothetical protein
VVGLRALAVEEPVIRQMAITFSDTGIQPVTSSTLSVLINGPCLIGERN